jgi:two-component system sensor histidine kinase/response regulator
MTSALHQLAQCGDASAWRALAPTLVDANLAALAQTIDAALLQSAAAAASKAAQQPALARACFDYALNGILETDGSGRILQANPAACSITGLRRTLLLRLRMQDLLDGQSQPGGAVQHHFAVLSEQGIHCSELELQAEGESRIIEVASVQVDHDRLLHVFDDITDRRKLMLAIESARNAAQQAERSKSLFLANMSHEIRTPLNGVIGLSQLALMTNPTPQQADYLDKIGHSSRLLLGVLNDVLDFSSVEAGRIDYEEIPFSIDDVLDQLVAPAAQAAHAKPLELVFRIGAQVPRHLLGDPFRLGQVLTNLLDNAIKFTAAGKVALTISSAPLPGSSGCMLSISVQDTGIGIAPADLGRLFAPFSQADASIGRRFGGTGLGLAIGQRLAKGMHGQIDVSSTLGQGSTFVASVPFAIAGSALSSSPSPASASALAPFAARAHLFGSKPATHAALFELLQGEGHVLADPATLPVAASWAEAVPDRWPDCLPDLSPDELLVFDCDCLAQGIALPDLQAHPKTLLLVDLDTHALLSALQGHAPALLLKPVTPASLRRALLCLDQAAPAIGLSTGSVPQNFAGATLLVVEDNRINQQVMKDLLRRAGIHVRLAGNGIEAVAALQQGMAPDLVLMDVHMPGMDGLAATRSLRAAGHVLPIVGLSAATSPEEQRRCLRVGMSDFLAKPVDLDQLWSMLARQLPAPALAADFPGIDLADALPRFLNRVDQLRKMLDLFIEQQHGMPATLLALHASGDWVASVRLLHELKGSAGLLGATAVSATAKALEALLQHRQYAALPALYDRLRQELEQLG